MSYSFHVRAASKAEAKEKAFEEFAKVAAEQPSHTNDLVLVQTAVEGLIAQLAEPSAQQIEVQASGSKWENESGVLQVSASIAAALVNKV